MVFWEKLKSRKFKYPYNSGWRRLKKYWFHVTLLLCITLPIVTLVFLDYYNLEGYNYRYDGLTDGFESWDNIYFNQNFTFESTWKGRFFYLVFLWLLVIESAISWQEIVDKKPRNRLILASLIIALIPTIYILATNFFGLDLVLLKAGRYVFDIHSLGSSGEPSDFLHLFWPLSLEYIVFTIFFMGAVSLAYKLRGLRAFAISFALLGGIGIAYMLDTIYPFGVFKPLQELALPTAATTAALFDLLGYSVQMHFPIRLGESLLPSLTVTMGGKTASVTIAWACAGVHSLLLYVLIMFVFFKKTSISAFRKLLYFIIGLFGTFFVNVLRVYSIIIIMLQSGNDAGMNFHNTYGELYSFVWIFSYILLIGCMEKFMLVERARAAFRRLGSSLGVAGAKSASGLGLPSEGESS